MLSTYSGHRAMPPDARKGMFVCITNLIDNEHGGQVTKRYDPAGNGAPSDLGPSHKCGHFSQTLIMVLPHKWCPNSRTSAVASHGHSHRLFTEAEHARNHCQVGNPTDW